MLSSDVKKKLIWTHIQETAVECIKNGNPAFFFYFQGGDEGVISDCTCRSLVLVPALQRVRRHDSQEPGPQGQCSGYSGHGGRL